jgi:hypothetical protein
MDVDILPETREELKALPRNELVAMLNALDKLQVVGVQLPHPHSSQVKGTQLRELRPRAGRSPWRALYQRVGDRIVVAAIAPEAQHDPRGFQRAIRLAMERLDHLRMSS